MKRALIPILALLLAFAGACRWSGSGTGSSAISVPRPHPGYMRWMEKESMLSMAPALIAQVSQTERIWLNSGLGNRSSILLDAAPNWLILDAPATSSVFNRSAGLVDKLNPLGLNGLYLGDTAEKDSIWNSEESASPAAVALNFDESAFGTEHDYETFISRAESAKVEVGSALLPIATGIGPDFMLCARNAPGRAGLYAMLAMPPEYWSLLPPLPGTGAVAKLDSAAVRKLASAGLIPESLRQDEFGWLGEVGWAATGPIDGVDGQPRRWIYRYATKPERPVLLWQDPGGLARTVLSAAIIRQTGLLGQSLLGVHAASLMGLEPPSSEAPRRIQEQLAPGIGALNDISAQIHRYGGWAMQADPVPVSVMEAVLRGNSDFCLDVVTEILALEALLHDNPENLRLLYDSFIDSKLPVHRLARAPLPQRLPPEILADRPGGAQLAAVLGQLRGQAEAPLGSSGQTSDPLGNFFLAWRLGLPGLVFVAETELQDSDAGGNLTRTLLARKKGGLANATVSRTFLQGQLLGILSRLPDGNWWLAAGNFSPRPGQLRLTIPGNPSRGVDAGSGQLLEAPQAGGDFIIRLDGRQARNVVFYAG